jgi:hypothetical protein
MAQLRIYSDSSEYLAGYQEALSSIVVETTLKDSNIMESINDEYSGLDQLTFVLIIDDDSLDYNEKINSQWDKY